MEVRERTIESDLAGTHEVETRRHVASSAELNEESAVRAMGVVSFVFWAIEALLALCFVFGVFGAARVGFANFLYSITDPFVAPFRGIFPAPTVEGNFFDSAAFVAMIVLALLAWVVASLVATNTTPNHTHRYHQ